MVWEEADRETSPYPDLPAMTSSGKQSGIGFIVMSGESKAIWDGLTPINIRW